MSSIPMALDLPVWAWAVLAVVAAYALRRPFLKLLTPRSIPGIPAFPNPSPLWGDLPRMTSTISKTNSFSYFFDEVAKELGPIAQVRVSFFERFVILTDYQEIEAVLNNHSQFDRAGNTIDMFRTILPNGQIALPTNKMWRHHRRLVGTAMTSKYLSQSTPKANEAVKNIISLWQEKIKVAGGKAFAADHDLEATTMDAICAMAFGSSWDIIPSYIKQATSCTTGDLGQAVFPEKKPQLAESTWAIFASVPQMSLLPGFTHFLTSLTPTYRRHHKRLYNFFAEKVAASRAQAKLLGADEAIDSVTNTLDMMVARELRGEDWLPEAEMKDELYQYLLAGSETTAATLSWWLKYMTNNPGIQRKLREHILSRMPELQDRQPTYDDLNATTLPYLEAMVHEILRLSRTAGGYTREAKEDAVVMGKVVPKGTTLLMPTVTSWEDESTPVYAGAGATAPERTKSVADARSEKATRKVGFWEAGTAKQFQPERWLDAQGNLDLNAGPSLPFSMGQRSCFGKNLAMLELRLFICQLNLAFFFAPVEDKLNSFAQFETVANHPAQCFIRPVAWSSPLSRK